MIGEMWVIVSAVAMSPLLWFLFMVAALVGMSVLATVAVRRVG